MDHSIINTESSKNKHLSFQERIVIQLLLKDVFTPYKIAKELNRPNKYYLNEISRSTTIQIKQGTYTKAYLVYTGKAVYKKESYKFLPSI